MAKAGPEWASDACGETGDGSFGERTERVDAGILMLNHPPYGSSQCAQEDHSPEWQQLEGKQ